MSQLYQVVTNGSLVEGVDIQSTRDNLKKLFKLDDTQIDIFFTGKTIIVKKGLSSSSALKYQKAIQHAGMLCTLNSDEPKKDEKSEKKEQAFRLAPVGSRMGPMGKAQPAPPDVSHLDVAERGSDLLPDKIVTEVEAPDVSHLILDPVGITLVKEKEVESLELNLDHISVAPVGSDMGENPRDSNVKAPDISHIRLEDE